jgi:hypothetical protein
MEKSNSTTRAFSNLQDLKGSQESKPMGWQCSKKIEEMSPVCSTGLIASYLEPCIELNFAKETMRLSQNCGYRVDLCHQ